MTTNNTCKKCGCQDSFMVSPAPCPTPVDCPTPQPCSEVVDAQCVIYTGPNITCDTDIVVTTNDSVAEALENIIDYFCANAPSPVTLASAGGTETLVNDGVGPALATKGLTAGTGISLTGTGTDITITNSDTGSAVVLTSAGGSQTLVNDGTGPSLATKGLTAGNGINLFSSATAVTIATLFDKFAFGAIAGNQSVVHGLGTLDVIVSIKSATLPLPFTAYIHGTDYTYVIDNPNQITITDITGMGAYTVTVIG